MLDRYSYPRAKAVEQELIHILRRQRQINIAVILSCAFEEYHQMNCCRICSESNNTYEEAEQMAEVFGDMFDMDIPPTVFLLGEKHTDEAIEHYRRYKKDCEVVRQFGYTEDDVDAFCKQVEHGAYKIGLTSFYAFNSLGYRVSMRGVLEYVLGKISQEQLEKSLLLFIPPKVVQMDKRQSYSFAKTMFRVVREFEQIAEKRAKRKQC